MSGNTPVGRVGGKVALITGAARGQGRSHAVRLAEEGADVIALDIAAQVDSVAYDLATVEELDETARLVEKAGRRVFTRVVDVRDDVGLAGAVDDGVAELGRLDIVSANAGVISLGALADLSEQQWGDVVDINLSGVWRTVKVAVPHLIAAGGGVVVLTGSVAGTKGTPGVGHYGATKHGLIGLTKTFALELAPHGIRVNALLPGNVNTPMILNDSTYRIFSPGEENPTQEMFAEVAVTTNVLPVPWVESIDVSNALLFLVSDDARYITGAALPVDAGAGLK